MSYNQSMADRSDSSQYGKAGRSGSFSQRNNNYSVSTGKGGGVAALPPSSNLQQNRSFSEKSNNVQGGQSRASKFGVISNPDSNSTPANRPAPNGSHSQPAAPAPVTGTVVKQTADQPTQRTAQVVQKAQSSQATNVKPDPGPHATPTKGSGDASKSFPIQFGSASPGTLNGMQIPAKTSSAPPNLVEQERDQARRDSLRQAQQFPIPSVPKQQIPGKNGGVGDQQKTGEAHQIPMAKRDIQVPSPSPLSQTQKAPVHNISGISMPMPFHQQQVPVQFGSPTPQIRSQVIGGASLPMPMLPMGSAQLPQSVYVLGLHGGVQRSNSDADRWQRATGFQKGLFPSPTTPAPVMHKAERKYQLGKVIDEEEAKQRQLKAILNKLTRQNFEKLFKQVKAVNINNAGTLIGFSSQIFDIALMEPTFCEMYANFCYHLAKELPDFGENDEKITFKRLLLNKCQEEFEREGREQEEADKVDTVGEVKQSPEEREEKRIQARRRKFGNIRLIGELYKKKMLTERIMHECIKTLLGQYQNPDEEDIEALCKLMSTIGEMIDHPRAKEHMDAYFDMVSKLSNNMKLSSRVRFMLKDAIDLRKNKWQQRRKYQLGKVTDEEEAKQRQLKAILNKLTPRNFGKLFEQVKAVNIDYAGTLRGVISQIFDKALMEPTFCEMYTNICYHLAYQLPVFSENDKIITFKRLLLNKCQEEFERGRREQEEDDRADTVGEVKQSPEEREEKRIQAGKVKQSPEEREEKRIQARRRMFSNIRLIGELFKKKMFPERIMHHCIKTLLGQYQNQNQNPDEEDIEALCILMSTIGEMIDHPKTKEYMDAYFDMISELSNNMKLSSRVRFMLKDAIDLRKNKWQQRRKYQLGKVTDEEEAKQRQLKAILNKLTPQNFEKLFEQVKVVNIDNAGTLRGVISQIFDNALMETFCEMYANFCYCLAKELPYFSENDEIITFKRLLLNKIQEEFERGEREEEEADRADTEGEVKQSPEEREEKRIQARRRMFGNIRLIGELYKKKMLTVRIMHVCIQELLGQYQNPDEEDIEALCKLMSTIGQMIDHPKAKEDMDAYFDMMSELSNNVKLSSRVRFMLKDTIDLRKNKWQQRRKVGRDKIDRGSAWGCSSRTVFAK